MKRNLMLAVFLGAVVSSVIPPVASAASGKDEPATAAPSRKLVLQKDMTAEEILRYYGKPDEVTPMAGSEIKAEKWIYRRVADSGIIQTANTERRIQSFVGLNDGGKSTIGDVIIPDYRLKFVRVYQVTSLLIVDGKLQLGRQWHERSEQFAN